MKRTVTYLQAKNALVDIGGEKFSQLLLSINKSNATDIRRKILQDYSYNSHSYDGIKKLGIVLTWISEEIKHGT